MTRDPVREALVSARSQAWLAYVDHAEHESALLRAFQSAADAVTEYDRTTPRRVVRRRGAGQTTHGESPQ